MPDVPPVAAASAVPEFNIAAAALASAEEMAKIAEEAPVLIPILATGAKTVVDLIRNDAPALVADVRTLAADLKAPDAIQAALANDELVGLLVRGSIWIEKRVAAAIASGKKPDDGPGSAAAPAVEGQ